MKNPVKLISLFAILSAPCSALALSTHAGGEICQPTAPADGPLLGYSQFGVHNVSTNLVAGASCTVPQVFSTVSRVNVAMYDRHSGANIVCNVVLTDSTGNTTAFAQIQSVGSGAAPQIKTALLSGTGNVHLTCGIPMIAPNGGVSHIANIWTE